MRFTLKLDRKLVEIRISLINLEPRRTIESAEGGESGDYTRSLQVAESSKSRYASSSNIVLEQTEGFFETPKKRGGRYSEFEVQEYEVQDED